MPLKGILDPGPFFSYLSFPKHHDIEQLCSTHTPAMMFSLATGPKQQGQGTMDWDLWNINQNKSFLPLSWLSQILCYSKRKLTNTLWQQLTVTVPMWTTWQVVVEWKGWRSLGPWVTTWSRATLLLLGLLNERETHIFFLSHCVCGTFLVMSDNIYFNLGRNDFWVFAFFSSFTS
jgi:hypothetical protein